MRRSPQDGLLALTALVALAAFGLSGRTMTLDSIAAQDPSFHVSPSSAQAGDVVSVEGTGCEVGGTGQSVLVGPGGAAVGPQESYVPDADGAWGGAYPLPKTVEAGDGYRFTARCLDATGAVLVEYSEVEFTIVTVEPTPTPITSTATAPSTPSSESAEPLPTPSNGSGSPSSTPGATGSSSPSPSRTTDDPLLNQVNEVLNALEKGSLAFRPPHEMKEGLSYELVIHVRRPSVPGDPATDLPGEGPPVVVPVKVSTAMTAELTGSNFQIEPSGPQKRILSSTYPAEWRWTVTPKKFGTSNLRLRLAVVLAEDPGTPLIPQVTYDEQIEVKVRPLYTAQRLLKTVQGALTASGLTAAVVVAALWQYIRRRRSASHPVPPDKPEPDAPAEVPAEP